MPQTREERLAKKREYNQHRYAWLKEHGLCVGCGKSNAVPGKVLCWDCADKSSDHNAEYYAKLTPEQKKEKQDKRSIQRRLRRERREALHQCKDCGKQLADAYKYKYCIDCHLKRKHQYDAWRAKNGRITNEQRFSGSFCVHCCKPLESGQSRLCPDCYKRAVESAARMRESRGCKENLKLQHKLNGLVFIPREV